MKVLYKKCEMVRLEEPYVAGYLGFREAPHLIRLLQEVPEYLWPEAILVDGNGVLHPRNVGVACHIGVHLNLPTIGVAKKLLGCHGLWPQVILEKFAQRNPEKGDTMDLVGRTGRVHGKIYQSSSEGSRYPLFVSVGHKISLDSAVWVVSQCCPRRVVEPIRRADLISRDFLDRLKRRRNLPKPEKMVNSRLLS